MRARLLVAMLPLSCAPATRPFPLRPPLWQDADLRPVVAPCHPEPTTGDARHVSCAPAVYRSAPLWDEADSVLFRPLSEGARRRPERRIGGCQRRRRGPRLLVVHDRLGIRPMGVDELALGGCQPSQILDPDPAADGTWVIDRGKTGGNSPGFRVSVPGKGKYLFKLDDVRQPEQSSAATVIGAAVYHAVGYNTTCEQVVYFRPALLTLSPGLRYKFSTFGEERAFGRGELDAIVRSAPRRGDAIRMVASAWLPGRPLGPFRYEGTRADDPNDVVPHEDRRELRANRVVAAWLGHVDVHEQNSLDLWLADAPGPPDASPGHVVHTYLDWGDCLGGDWPQEEITRRMGYAYIVDWGDMAADFLRLGVASRPWEDGRAPGHELFGYYDVAHFVPDAWKNEYPNPAFTRMTERDAAWIARILARFTAPMVRALAELARYSDPSNTEYLARVLQGRLDRILDRYLTRVSPIADVHVDGNARLCALDLAAWRGVRDGRPFRPSARTDRGALLRVAATANGRMCLDLPHVAPDAGIPDDAASRYVRLVLTDGLAQGALRAHLYDLGPIRGYRLVGVERGAP